MLMKRGEVTTLREWIEALPQELLRSRIILRFWHGWTLAILGHYALAESLLQDVEQAPGSNTPLLIRGGTATQGSVPEGTRRFTRNQLLSEVMALRSFIAFRRGNYPLTITLARQALERLSKTSISRSFVAWNLGTVYKLTGDIQAASEALAEARMISQAQGNSYAVFLATFELASLQIQQGRLHHAEQIYRQALHLTAESSASLPASAHALIGVGCLQYEWNQLERAAHSLEEGLSLCLRMGNPKLILQGYAGLACVKQAQGDTVGARTMLEQAMQTADSYNLPPERRARVGAWQARLSLLQGETAGAFREVIGRAPACG
jgi:LuxR family maltose regulon positive regulatory protein